MKAPTNSNPENSNTDHQIKQIKRRKDKRDEIFIVVRQNLWPTSTL